MRLPIYIETDEAGACSNECPWFSAYDARVYPPIYPAGQWARCALFKRDMFTSERTGECRDYERAIQRFAAKRRTQESEELTG